MELALSLGKSVSGSLLLKGEKGTLEHDKLLNKIHSSYGTSSFITHIKKYIEKYGLPDDVSTLL
ncbi:MAG: hypothetical protein N2Z84_05745, partial [Atribacterota bacterium]|nr:hypothetical protein [Atribacterota bacterium]